MATHTRTLPVRLNTIEKADRADQLARRTREAAEDESKRKAVAKQWKDKIDEHKAALRDLATAVEKGEEPRPVECMWERDDRALVMREIRLDTGAEVDRRPMTQAELEERQTVFPGVIPITRDTPIA